MFGGCSQSLCVILLVSSIPDKFYCSATHTHTHTVPHTEEWCGQSGGGDVVSWVEVVSEPAGESIFCLLFLP